MSGRWNRATERGWEADRPISNGPPAPVGPDGQYRAGVRPPLTARTVQPRRSRVAAS